VDLDEELEQFEGSFKQDGIIKTCWYVLLINLYNGNSVSYVGHWNDAFRLIISVFQYLKIILKY
jgi:hypothetical protein